MPKLLLTLCAALSLAAALSACGGGEEADATVEAPMSEESLEGVPMRGPQWLAAPADEGVPGPG